MAPILGADLSYVTDVDARVRALDANQATGDSRHGLPPDRVNDILAVADVLLVGYPVAGRLAGRAPRLAWAHHTQAGVSNLAGSDLWTSPVTLTTSRGVVGRPPSPSTSWPRHPISPEGCRKGPGRNGTGSSPPTAMSRSEEHTSELQS